MTPRKELRMLPVVFLNMAVIVGWITESVLEILQISGLTLQSYSCSLHVDPSDGDMGECSAAAPDGGEGVSLEAIGLGVGIGLGLVLVVVVVSVLLSIWCRQDRQPYDPVSAGELTART
ncbi:hypothetical protein Bbelb_318330 [Branchiostoma belcheri]|nr:hypothetical protein Bbelb_318330 [Branchiostoma belcheri]